MNQGWWILFFLLLLMAGCGGGGSDTVADREIGPNEHCTANLDNGKCPIDAIIPNATQLCTASDAETCLRK